MAQHRVVLNVGGRLFECYADTLRSRPDSLLGRMFDPQNSLMLKPDTTGHYFFDRNGDLFAPILDYYRTGVLLIPPNVSRVALMNELDFFALDVALVNELEINRGSSFGLEPRQAAPFPTFHGRPSSRDASDEIQNLGKRIIPIVIECLRHNIHVLTLHVSRLGRLQDAELVPRRRRNSATSSPTEDPEDPAQPPTLSRICADDPYFFEDLIALFYHEFRTRNSNFVRELHEAAESMFLSNIHFVDATADWAREDGMASKVRFSGLEGWLDDNPGGPPFDLDILPVPTDPSKGLPLVGQPATAQGRGSQPGAPGLWRRTSIANMLGKANDSGAPRRLGYMGYDGGWRFQFRFKIPYAKARDDTGAYWYYLPQSSVQ
ncbi:hypothetical protein BJ742DRAFT_826739 [Cladochytrium replicatum]|nr:hypothetical protein BJ742DRAFT_826739 [Cladochytrium replicatum]